MKTQTKHILIDTKGSSEVLNDFAPKHFNRIYNSILLNSYNETGLLFEIEKKLNYNAKSLRLIAIENKIFECNLNLIDTVFPIILGEIISISYYTGITKIADLTKIIHLKNPIGYNYKNGQKFYEYKLKRFLSEIAQGMAANVIWKGNYTGNGFINEIENVESICYYNFDINNFEDFLFNNTCIDISNNHIYEENGKFYLKLNLQVRFL
jgi:hypothetical protein